MHSERHDFDKKVRKLRQMISEHAGRDMAVAFSGGVDSSLLLKICCDSAGKRGTKVWGITVHTRLHPMSDVGISRRVCRETGAEFLILDVDELEEAGILDNPPDRCYLCKKNLFSRIKAAAEDLHIPVVMDGTNEDDLHVYRPGIRALKELGILSPLAACGMGKEEVRMLAAEYGISVADRPSAPCMATRFPYGTRLDEGELKKVEAGEEWFSRQGFYNIRLRVHGDILRIEVDEEELEKALSMRVSIISRMKELGYRYVTLDLEGFRSGSMDIGLEEKDN